MKQSIQERDATTLPGMLMVLLLLVFTAAVGWWAILSFVNLLNPIPAIVVLAFLLFLWAGFFIVQPNQAAVLQFFGKFVGVERSFYLRLRGSDGKRLTSSGDPMIDELANSDPWADLWFYANPVFVDVI